MKPIYDKFLVHKEAIYANKDGTKTLYIGQYHVDNKSIMVYCWGAGFFAKTISWKKFIRTVKYHRLEKLDFQVGDLVLVTRGPHIGKVYELRHLHQYQWSQKYEQFRLGLKVDGKWLYQPQIEVNARDVELVFRK